MCRYGPRCEPCGGGWPRRASPMSDCASKGLCKKGGSCVPCDYWSMTLMKQDRIFHVSFITNEIISRITVNFCLSVCLVFVCLSACLPVCWFVCMSVCVFIYKKFIYVQKSQYLFEIICQKRDQEMLLFITLLFKSMFARDLDSLAVEARTHLHLLSLPTERDTFSFSCE